MENYPIVASPCFKKGILSGRYVGPIGMSRLNTLALVFHFQVVLLKPIRGLKWVKDR